MPQSIILSLALVVLLVWGVRQYNVHMRTDARLEELDNLAQELAQQDFSDMLKTPANSTQLKANHDSLNIPLSPSDTVYVQQQYMKLFQQAMHEHYQEQVTEQEAKMLLESFHSIRNAHMNAALTVERQNATMKKNLSERK